MPQKNKNVLEMNYRPAQCSISDSVFLAHSIDQIKASFCPVLFRKRIHVCRALFIAGSFLVMLTGKLSSLSPDSSTR